MRFLIVLSLFFGLFSCTENSGSGNPAAVSTGQSNAEAPDITVQVAGAAQDWMYIIGTYTDQQYKLDSARIDATGTAHFKQNAPYQQGFVYFMVQDKFSIQALISEDQTFSLTTNLNNIVGDMVVKGSIDNELYYRNAVFESEQRPVFNTLNSQLQGYIEGSVEYTRNKEALAKLLEERKAHLKDIFTSYPNSFFVSFKKAGQNPDVQEIRLPDGSLDRQSQVYNYRTQFWDDVDFTDERLIYTPVISNKLKRYIDELTPQNPDSIMYSADYLMSMVPEKSEYYKYFANWIVTHYDPKESTLMDPQAVFTNMVEQYFTYDKAFWADSTTVFSLQQRAYEMSASLVGKKGPNVEAANPNGKAQSIYAMDAPYIIVYMYTPSCEHCAVETPKLVEFYKQWHPKGVDVFGIAVDTEHQEWVDYIAKNKMPWVNNVFDPTNKAIYAKYFVDVTPEIYVLNPERIIIAKNLKVEQIATMIERDMASRK
ncbi:MAG: redoxin domain-containing protein [Saprospiraceae bacterium]|nr:redoxin domain-containing protein [Saprospiraceae bacterium]